MALSDQFKAAEWYSWNMAEDSNPTSYENTVGEGAATQESISQQTTELTGSTMENGLTQAQSTQETQLAEEGGYADAPTILKPAEDARTIDKGPVTISGTVPSGTAKVTVEQVVDEKTETYNLMKFKSGDTTFSYNLSESFGNLAKGDNTYSFYAFDKDGNKSPAATITITLNKSDVTITDALTAPTVKTFNGAESSTVTVDTVTVAGEIKGAEKVVVNGYTLSKFVAGSTSWSYVAKESLGNLKSGVNDFEVYGIDTDGNKSDVVKFTITYNKPAGSTVTQQSTTSGTQPAYGF
jgi:hypothetical protein